MYFFKQAKSGISAKYANIGPTSGRCYIDIDFFLISHNWKLSINAMNCNNKLFKINLVQHIKTVYFVFQISISDRHRADIAYFVINT